MKQLLILVTLLLITLTIRVLLNIYRPGFLENAFQKWPAAVEPGKLSKFHEHLEKDCKQCHSTYKGVDRDKCVVCHAAETEILKKQNTSFHASITSCTGCHLEHQGREASINKMDHTHLALVAAGMLKPPSDPAKKELELMSFLRSAEIGYHGTNVAAEKTLNCTTCHANQDRHRTLFGNDCITCHDTKKWAIAAFRHPMPTSRDCSQCHQAPPSHYMMHFDMISKKVAGQEDSQVTQCCGKAQVNQCYRCHQTTSWNDIKGVGWYKHH